ncbi:hypothetical protein GTU79_12165 [Sodalis ligni]|uniref:hypothetical protein n=1 Tax=Sodalis ligni TaxID=2697027 RepID=UPI001BDF51FA|nr:hypothetical protein [Sodalis ligni]QWA13300.1 hypothetical protein GTU79_12165 [Sodalis ligni]
MNFYFFGHKCIERHQTDPAGTKILLALREKPSPFIPDHERHRACQGRYILRQNSAGGAIAFDPGNFIIGDGTTLKAEPWRNRDPAIALYHELLHIYYNTHPAKFRPVGEATAIKGTSVTKTADKTAEITIAGGGSELEEALITGISFRDPITKELYDFKK